MGETHLFFYKFKINYGLIIVFKKRLNSYLPMIFYIFIDHYNKIYLEIIYY